MSNDRDHLVIEPVEGYATVVSYALANLEKEREQTVRGVENLSVEQLDAYAQGFSNSIGSLLYHIAGIELDWLYSEILEQDIPKNFYALFPVDVRDDEGQLSALTGIGLAEHLNRLAVVRTDLFKHLKGMTEDEFYRVRELPPYDVNPAWVMYHLLEHEAKHGEQIAHIRCVLSASSSN